MKFSYLALFLLPFLSAGCSSCSSSGNTPPPSTYNLPPGPLTSEGLIMTDIAGGDDSAKAIQVQEDGKILVAGNSFNGSNTDITLVRYLENGTLDPTFATDGIFTLDISDADDHAKDMTLAQDGSILIVGDTLTSTGKDIVLIRVLATGELDPTFGSGGWVMTDIAGKDDSAGSVLETEGTYLVGGMAQNESPCTTGVFTYDFVLIRYLENGDLDPAFGIDGIAITDLDCDQDYGEKIALQSDGKIILAGSTYVSPAQDYCLARYDSQGILDTSFGSGGFVITEMGEGYDFSKGVLIQEDLGNKIILAGAMFVENSGGFNFGAIRYLSNGDVDTSFGSDGIQTIDFSGGTDVADCILPLSNGKIVLAGWGENGADRDFAVSILFANGPPDLSYGSGGSKMTGFGFGDDYGHAACLTPQGKILVAGGCFNGTDLDFGIAIFEGSQD